MARYRRKNSYDTSQDLAIMLTLILVLLLIHPKLRDLFLSSVKFLLGVIFIGIIIRVIYYLYNQHKSMSDLKPSTSKISQGVNNSLNSSSEVINTFPSNNSNPSYYSVTPYESEYTSSIEPKKWDDTILSTIEWKRFEVVCKEFIRLVGFEPIETNIGADGGIDIKIYKNKSESDISSKPEAIVQCKAWNSYKVGVKIVRELFGVMAAENVKRGMIMTSGEFTNEAIDFAKGKKIILLSGNNLLQKIHKLPEEKQQELLDIALEGDYMTPTCPRCDLKMALRKSKFGKEFWGCVRYPRCRQTFALSNNINA